MYLVIPYYFNNFYNTCNWMSVVNDNVWVTDVSGFINKIVVKNITYICLKCYQLIIYRWNCIFIHISAFVLWKSLSCGQKSLKFDPPIRLNSPPLKRVCLSASSVNLLLKCYLLCLHPRCPKCCQNISALSLE